MSNIHNLNPVHFHGQECPFYFSAQDIHFVYLLQFFGKGLPNYQRKEEE